MCGIFGLLNYKETLISRDIINSLNNKAKHRGPESSRTYYNKIPDFVLGFHRLAINGLNSQSNQPISMQDCILICNGEIYNFKELFDYINTKPKTDSDCEIIIHLYRKIGIENTLQKLDGVFAFILYDNLLKKLYVSRDPLGVRPLFKLISSGHNVISFGSELKQLYGMKHYMHDAKICQFESGIYEEYMMVNETLVHSGTRQYVNFPFYTLKSLPNSEWTHYYDLIRYNLEQAVIKRVENTDRPVACLLSGGLDSSLVTSIVKKHYSGILETYSIGLKGSEDLRYAKEVATFLGTKHTEIVMSEDDFFNSIPEVIEKIESYDTTTVRASVGNYLIGKYISTHSDAKVIFNGDGSDELAGGYLYFHCAPTTLDFDIECRRLLKDIKYFDVLRSDRSISTNGLEPRTPFLDRGWVEFYLSIPMHIRCHTSNNVCEKYLIRKAFDNNEYLPQNILWRKKEAFSDGVSSLSKPWYEIINQKVNNIRNLIDVTEEYKINKPITLEQFYYRELFEQNYKGCANIIPYFWMPKFVKTNDCSARTLDIYKTVDNDEIHVEQS